MAAGSAREYLERTGLMPTYRLPLPKLDTTALRIHWEPLESPLPNPDAMSQVNGDPPPDRGVTQEWPAPQESPYP